MKRQDRKNPLSGLRAARPPQDLAQRVLSAAASAADAAEPGSSIWDRLWYSRPLRVSWLVALLMLALAHMTLGRAPGSGSSRETVAEIDNLDEFDELDEIFHLPAIEISPRAESIALGGKRKQDRDRRIDS